MPNLCLCFFEKHWEQREQVPGDRIIPSGDGLSTSKVPLDVPTFLYRLIQDEVPTTDDFRTTEQLGKPLLSESLRREWSEGISVYDDEDYALNRARRNRTGLGRYVVPMAVPEDGSVDFAQTTRDAHHYTIYAYGQRALDLVCGPAVQAIECDDG